MTSTALEHTQRVIPRIVPSLRIASITNMQYLNIVFKALIVLVTILPFVASTHITNREPGCVEVVFSVSVSALNAPLAGLTLDNFIGSLASLLFTIPSQELLILQPAIVSQK